MNAVFVRRVKLQRRLSLMMERIHLKSPPPFYQRYPPRLPAALLDPLGLVSHTRKFAYFRIFKAANSTVVASLYHAQTGMAITTLRELQVVKDFYYARPSQLCSRALGQLAHSYFKFTFVRAPYARVCAAFLDKVVPPEQDKHRLVTRGLGKPDDAQLSFADFLNYLEAGGLDKNAHWTRQVDLLAMTSKNLDFVGRTENLAADLPHVLGVIFGGQPPVISVKEHATSASRMVAELDAATRDRIWRLYQPDFEEFDYPK